MISEITDKQNQKNMKTILTIKLFLILASIALIGVSCKKDTSFATPTANLPTSLPSANILDMGLIDSINHLMVATLNNETVTFTNSVEDLTGINAQISFDFYSNEDGLIPTGTYYFSNDGTAKPFTFSTGSFLANVPGSSSALNLSVVDGTVYLTQSDANYELSYALMLSDGNTVSGSYSGNMAYQDSSVKK